MPRTPHVLTECRGEVLVVRLNRPEVRNAVSSEMLCRLRDAWDKADAEDAIRAVVLTGTDDAFSAGADLKALASAGTDDEWTRRLAAEPDIPFRAMLRDRRPTKPVIAAVEGPAIAGGTELLQGTDIRIAAEGATFGLSEPRWGQFPLGGSTVRLPRQIGFSDAMYLLLTGDHITAADAREIGLVTRVVPDGQALSTALEIAGRIARNGPLAVQAIKRSVYATWGLPEQEALRIEGEIGFPIWATKDAKEGPRAFAEKREPRFEGR